MDMRVLPKYEGGRVRAIPSKSQAHRALICAALADRPTEILVDSLSQDIERTIGGLRSLGAKIEGERRLRVSPVHQGTGDGRVDCGESGSTLRFLLPVAAALGKPAAFWGVGRLPGRPLGDLIAQMEAQGVHFTRHTLPFHISGRLSGGPFFLPGDVSSQYVSGLLLALPVVGGGSVSLQPPLESRAYVDMTVAVQRAFGVCVMADVDTYTVPPDAAYRSPGSFRVEGDWSNAALWLCAGAVAGETTVTGLDAQSLQGDRAVADLLERFGARVHATDHEVTAAPGNLRGIAFDASDIPDLVPALSVVAAVASGTTRISGVRRLRLKECDRLMAVLRLLGALGCRARMDGETLLIEGTQDLHAAEADSFGDHRMAMAAVLAALAAKREVLVANAGVVDKSYPGFFADLKGLGGAYHVQ